MLEAFNYTKSSVLKDSIYFGQYSQYTGGGYVFNMKNDLEGLINDLNTLQKLSWIDKRTRAIFIEFSLYNPNLNLFSFSEMLFEIISSGNVLPSATFISTNFWSPSREVTVTGCLIAYMIVIVILMTNEMNNIKKKAFRYFVEFWSLVDLTLFACSWAALAIYLYKLYALHYLLNEIQENSIQSYINMSSLSNQNETLGILFSFCSFIATIKMIKLLRFDNDLLFLIEVVQRSFSKFLSFSIAILIIWLAYLQLMYLIYNQYSFKFKNFVKAMESSVLLLIGPGISTAKDLLIMNYTLGAILFSTYTVVMMLFLFNIMIIIIEKAFHSVKEEKKLKNTNDSLFQHFIRKFKNKKPDNTLGLKYYEVCDIFKLRSFELIDRLKENIQRSQMSLELINEIRQQLLQIEANQKSIQKMRRKKLPNLQIISE